MVSSALLLIAVLPTGEPTIAVGPWLLPAQIGPVAQDRVVPPGEADGAEPDPEDDGDGAPPEQKKQPGGILDFLMNPMVLLPLGLVFLYLVMIRPRQLEQEQEAQDRKSMLENLKKHDRVMTYGGVIGTVVNLQKNSDEVTLLVDESSNTRIKFLLSAIKEPYDPDKKKDKEDD